MINSKKKSYKLKFDIGIIGGAGHIGLPLGFYLQIKAKE